MDISDKDLLSLIALHIDCILTWNAFALTCKRTAQIAKTFCKLKKEQFKYIQFDVDINPLVNRINCYWHGRFTKGSIGVRGTRVWFQPRGLDVIHDGGDCDENDLKEFKEEVIKPEIDFPGDLCQLRKEELKDIIEGLENLNHKVCRFTTILDQELEDHLDYRYWNLKEMIPHDELLLIDVFPIKTVWRINDLMGVVEELKEVLSRCKKYQVTFYWV